MKRTSINSILASVVIGVFAVSARAQANESLRTELLAMEKADQDARNKCTNLKTADEQGKCLYEASITIDTPNTKRLEAIFDQYGFPDTALVGRDGFNAYMILLQHTVGDELRKKSVGPIKEAFKRKELPPMDYANFIDRYRLHQGKPQLYGSGFETKDGKLVMSKAKDIKNLDKRRAEIGLPPIAEYVKGLEEMYHLEVELPKQN